MKNKHKHTKQSSRRITQAYAKRNRKSAKSHSPDTFHKKASRKTVKYFHAKGDFCGTKNGYGFVTPEDGGEDIFIPAHCVNGALDGDRVSVRYTREEKGKTSGEVTEIIERTLTTLTGEIVRRTKAYPYRSNEFVVIPDSKRLSITPRVSLSRFDREGDKVEIMLKKNKHGHDYEGEIIRNFGPSDSVGANYAAILAECDIPTEFPDDVLAIAENAANEPLDEAARRTLDREIIFTIDGADAKDLDDAISLVRLPRGKWLLGVHIADVSHYVKPNTALDREAMKRGTSVYFTDKVVPMLPPVLSNGACSLNAGEKKYAMSAHITLSQDGKIEGCKIERTVIRSRVRGVYSEVNSVLSDGKASPYYKKYSSVYSTLQKMYELYKILEENSRKRGALELDSAEAKIILGSDGEVTDIVKRERGEAERLIEQFMLTANEAVANLMSEKEFPCVYRIHEPPVPDKLEGFLHYAYNLGVNVAGVKADNASCARLSEILQQGKESGVGYAMSNMLLRAMSKARYSDECSHHYGLDIDKYCHFTSPIRRLSDLATHRMIGAVLLDGQRPEKYKSYARRASVAASESELRALTAERKIDALYKTLYMSQHIGECYDATITSVTRFGLFAELENTCEGLIPTPSLDGYFLFDEEKMTLSNGNKTYRIGDKIRICVEDADISSSTVSFSLCSDTVE